MSNFKFSDIDVENANETAQKYENKIQIFKNKLKSLIFNENIFKFNEKKFKIDETLYGEITRQSIGKIIFNEYEAKFYEEIKTHYDFEYLIDNKILLTYEPSYNSLYILEIRDMDFNLIKVKTFSPMIPHKPYFICTFGQFIIFYYYNNSNKLLVKYDQNINELKSLNLNNEITSLSSSENRIYLLSSIQKFNILVLNENLNILHRLGQTQFPDLPFYFPNEMKKILNRNKKFYCLSMDKVFLVDLETGNRIKDIDIESKLIKIDINGNLYLLDTKRSMIIVYDLNGELLNEISLIFMPEKIDFLIDHVNDAIFIFNNNKISKSQQII